MISKIIDVWKARHHNFVHTLNMLKRTGREDEEPCSSDEDEEPCSSEEEEEPCSSEEDEELRM